MSKENFILTSSLVFDNSEQLIQPSEEIQQATDETQQNQQSKLELINHSVLYPLPFEMMDRDERLIFSNTLERRNRNQVHRRRMSDRENISNSYANAACLSCTCFTTNGLYFGIMGAAQIPLCLEMSVPLSIFTSIWLAGASIHNLPRNVIEFPARSLNCVAYNALDALDNLKYYLIKRDPDLSDHEDNIKLKEGFKKIETNRIFYDRQEGKYYVAQSAISWDGKDIKIRDEERLSPLSPDVLWQPMASLSSPTNLNISRENLRTRTIPLQLEM